MATEILQVLGKFGGGVKSWNDLEDKPFYEESYTGEITIEYDGDPTGKTTVDLGDGILVKVSDWTSEPSELIGGIAVMGEESEVITADLIYDARAEGIPIVKLGEAMVIAYEPFVLDGINITETGIYVFDMGVSMSLKYTGTVTIIHKLDPKYLPNGYSGGGGGGGVSNVHVLDIGDEDLDLTTLDLSGYANGDVLVIVQNVTQ